MTKNTETTRRALYECLDRIRRAAKHRKLTLEFEGLLEEYLESITPKLMMMFADELLAERNGLQARLHAVDTAYAKSQEALGVAGEEVRRLQKDNSAQDMCIEQLETRVDELSKSNRELDAVVRNQRQAYAELYMQKNGGSQSHILDLAKAKLLLAQAALLEMQAKSYGL